MAGRFEDRVILNDIERVFHDHALGDRERLRRLLLDEGLHLSEAGHDLYFDCVLPVVTKFIPQLAAPLSPIDRASGGALAGR